MAILGVSNLKKYFPVRNSLFAARKWLKAVDDISFNIEKDRVFALVGESGCGKSTVARLVLRLLSPTAGKVFFHDKDVSSLNSGHLRAFRKSAQIIFQDPFASLNPRWTVFDAISEPLRIHKIVKKTGIRDAVAQLLEQVGLAPDMMNYYPHEFSGGQRQRICIARVLAVSPELIVADEPLSALDVSIQAQILNLLNDIKTKTKIAFLFISHDLNIVHYFSDNVGVMYLGRIIEQAETEELFKKPLHPYTELLLASAPGISPKGLTGQSSGSLFIEGEVPSPIDIPSGCPFHPRCHRRFEPCDKLIPEFKESSRRRLVACHLWN